MCNDVLVGGSASETDCCQTSTNHTILLQTRLPIMTKALAPHTPSIAASLIRPSRLKLKFVGAKKQKPAPPKDVRHRLEGRGWLASPGFLFRNNFSKFPAKPP